MLYEHLGECFAITEEQYGAVRRWVEENFIPIESLNVDRSSDRIRRIFESRPDGFLVHDEIIRDAMLACGYRVRRSRSGEFFFNISEKSPAIQDWRRRVSETAPNERRVWVWRGKREDGGA